MLGILLKTYYPQILLWDVPNGIFNSGAAAVGLFLAAMSLRYVYSFAENPKLWNTTETARAVYGMYVLRFVAVLEFAAMMFLVGRLNVNMPRHTWDITSFNKGFWNLWRIVAALPVPVCACLFNSHPFFRFYCAIAFPALALLDMVSQVDLAGWIFCIESGTCTYTSSKSTIYLWMYRDLISAALGIWGLVIAWFMWGHHGFCSNEIYMPPLEHRILTHELNQTSTRRRQVKRRLGDEDFVEW